MGKAARNRNQSAKEKIAAQRVAARRAEVRRQALLVSGSIVAVLAIVVTFVVIRAVRQPASAGSTSPEGTTLATSVVANITNVPATTLDKVGLGSALTYNKAPFVPISGPALTVNGKPEILYIGAEYCPYCATERWAMAVALSRFGTFAGLKGIHSDATDVYANTPTLTFYKSTYTSNYLAFTPVEETTVSQKPLQSPNSAQEALLTKYDRQPYVSEAGAIPFVDFGNKFLLTGAQYNPQLLQGQSWPQVATALQNPGSPIAQGADGAANAFTAALCKLTNDRPANVCTTAGVLSANGTL